MPVRKHLPLFQDWVVMRQSRKILRQNHRERKKRRKKKKTWSSWHLDHCTAKLLNYTIRFYQHFCRQWRVVNIHKNPTLFQITLLTKWPGLVTIWSMGSEIDSPFRIRLPSSSWSKDSTLRYMSATHTHTQCKQSFSTVDHLHSGQLELKSITWMP